MAALRARREDHVMNATLSDPPVIDTEAAWQAVCDRDHSQDGSFVFAVSTTGVYCRPSCAARRPNRENVSFFASPGDAEAAGYRACLRCKPRSTPPAQLLVEAVRALLDGSEDEAPGLTDLAQSLGVSAGHL